MFLYSALSSPLDRSQHFPLFALPGRPSDGAIMHNDYITHISTTVYSQVLIYTAESTGASVERTKMPNLRNGSKGGFEPGLTSLRVWHSTNEMNYRAPQSSLATQQLRAKIIHSYFHHRLLPGTHLEAE